jgi:outer membrane protein assembly factor BamD
MKPSTFRFARLCVVLLLCATAAGCAGSKKKENSALLSMTAEQLYRHSQELLARGELRQARAALERIQYDANENRQEIEPLARLALADATFYQIGGLALIDARNLYLDFVTLYANHPLAPYAQLQAGNCSLKQVSHPSKDQSLTQQAVTDLTEVLRRYPTSPYTGAARDLLRSAYSNLAESEFLIGKFYLDKKVYEAAIERFRRALKDYPDYDQRDKLLFHLARTLRLNHNEFESRVYLDQLVADYPQSAFVDDARKELASASDGSPAAQEEPTP